MWVVSAQVSCDSTMEPTNEGTKEKSMLCINVAVLLDSLRSTAGSWGDARVIGAQVR